MVDSTLLGNIQGDNWPGPHHDLGSFFLGDSHKAVPVNPQQLISCLKASILPGCSSFNHCLDVNSKTFLSYSFRGHNAQTHPIGLAESNRLNFWLFRMKTSIAIDRRTSHVLMGGT